MPMPLNPKEITREFLKISLVKNSKTTNSRSTSTNLSARTASSGQTGGSAAASPSLFSRSPIVAMAHLQDQPPSNLQAKFFEKDPIPRLGVTYDFVKR